MKKKILFLVLLSFFSIVGCSSAKPEESNSEKITVATVQRKIDIGMSGSEVLEALGSPNMISTDELRREVWVYDKVSSEVSQSSSGSGLSLIFVGMGNSNLKTSKSQKTMTIIIKFDADKKVRDFAYHTSQF